MRADDNRIYQAEKRRQEAKTSLTHRAVTFALQYPPEDRGRMQRIYECVSRGRFLANEEPKVERHSEERVTIFTGRYPELSKLGYSERYHRRLYEGSLEKYFKSLKTKFTIKE